MYPDFDFTQAAMNEDASQSFDQAEKQLEDIIETSEVPDHTTGKKQR